MKWLRALLQRNKDEGSKEQVTFGASSGASKNDHDYELTDPLHREPPWSIPIPLPYSSVKEILEQELRTVIVPNYRVIFSVPSEDPAMIKDWIVSRYTIRLKEQDSFGNKRNPLEDIVCIIALRYIEPNITAFDCDVPDIQNRPYYESVHSYVKVIIRDLYRRENTIKPTAQEIVLHDPLEVMKPWSMLIPLDSSKLHSENRELEGLEENIETILMREMNYQCQKTFNNYRVSVLSPVDKSTFARYTIREPNGDVFVCSLSLTFTSSEVLKVTFEPRENAHQISYKYINDRAQEVAVWLYRLYGNQEVKRRLNSTSSAR